MALIAVGDINAGEMLKSIEAAFGPLKARVDYRVLKLNGDPLYSTVHRVYSGIHLTF